MIIAGPGPCHNLPFPPGPPVLQISEVREITEEAKVLYRVIQWYQFLEANAATALAASAGLALGIAPLAMGVMPFSWRKVRAAAPFS